MGVTHPAVLTLRGMPARPPTLHHRGSTCPAPLCRGIDLASLEVVVVVMMNGAHLALSWQLPFRKDTRFGDSAHRPL